MATELEIEDFLGKLKDVYGDRFNTRSATVYAWYKGLKSTTQEALEKALQTWIEESQRIPTLSDIRAAAKKYLPAKPDFMTPDEIEMLQDIEQQHLRDGLIKIKSGGSSTWIRKEYACRIKGNVKTQIDAILEYFGHEDWLNVLRNELGLSANDGLRGINQFMSSASMVKKYRELVNNHVKLIPGVMEL